jgi:nuclear GTP-binding protein
MQQPAEAGPSSGITFHNPIDSALTRDSSSKAFMRELRKVIERSDVIIQVLDARDPEGTRSRWVEEEVRKRDIEGKKLLAVMNKIGEHCLLAVWYSDTTKS